MIKPLLFVICITLNWQSQEEAWPPQELHGAWKIEFSEYSENGNIQAAPNRVWPSFCVFAGDYYFSVFDSAFHAASGVKLTAHEKKDDGYFLLWPYHEPAIRLRLRKVADGEFLMIEEEKRNNVSTRITFKLSRIEKKQAADRVHRFLKDKRPDPQAIQFRGDAEAVLEKWMEE